MLMHCKPITEESSLSNSLVDGQAMQHKIETLCRSTTLATNCSCLHKFLDTAH